MEYRIIFYWSYNYVNAYNEELTPKREAMILLANEALKELKDNTWLSTECVIRYTHNKTGVDYEFE